MLNWCTVFTEIAHCVDGGEGFFWHNISHESQDKTGILVRRVGGWGCLKIYKFCDVIFEEPLRLNMMTKNVVYNKEQRPDRWLKSSQSIKSCKNENDML